MNREVDEGVQAIKSYIHIVIHNMEIHGGFSPSSSPLSLSLSDSSIPSKNLVYQIYTIMSNISRSAQTHSENHYKMCTQKRPIRMSKIRVRIRIRTSKSMTNVRMVRGMNGGTYKIFKCETVFI